MSDDIELRAAWAEAVAPGHRSAEWFDEVVGRHRQPHRRYHGVRHVVWVLRHVRALATDLAECAGPSFDAGAVTMAAFFHDAVYDPTATDNEQRSAALAHRALESLGWERARCDVVVALIGATAGHIGAAARSNVASAIEYDVLLDADLAVLGSEPAAYTAYATGVRAEYSHLSELEWAAGRAGLLRHLLARPTLYETEPARRWWEHAARANLAAELASLRV